MRCPVGKPVGSALIASSVALLAFLATGSACAGPSNPLGLRTTDANGCHLTDGRGFEAPTIVLMAGAYDKRLLDAAVVLEVIDVAIKAGCDIDEPDELGFSPLNAAILYNEPVLVERFLNAGADPHRKIASPRASINGLDSFEFLHLLETKAPSQNREALRDVLERTATDGN